MPRRVFFSFHYKRDSRRVAQVRSCGIIGNYDKPPFLSAADWEKVERQGDLSIKKWIDNNLFGSSITVVLIGAETYSRKWVKYEIEQSYKRGNGLLGITLHNIDDPLTGKEIYSGPNPFRFIQDNNESPLSLSAPVYDWITDKGRENIGRWIEDAAKKAGR